MKKIISATVIVFMLINLTGCYWNTQVNSHQIGLVMKDGVSVNEVVSAGRFTDMGWYSALKTVDVSAKLANWQDSDMWTSDKQSVKFSISITYSRDKTKAREMYEKYNLESTDDAALEKLVITRVPRVAKQITTALTLDQMISGEGNQGREFMQKQVFELLKAELKECYVELLDIGINDIGVDELYASKLKEKAAAKVESELAVQKTAQLAEQVKQEKAQTDVALEIARRDNLVAEEKNKVFKESPEAFELERLKLLQGMLKGSDKIYFVPEGTDLSVFLSGSGEIPVVK